MDETLLRPLVAVLLAGAASCAQDPVTTEEVLLLLDVGVPSEAVIATLDRRGGPAVVSATQLRTARDRGASEALCGRLEARLAELVRIGHLAERFLLHREEDPDLSLLVPAGWHGRRADAGPGRFVELRPQDAAGAWPASGGLFLWILPETVLVPPAEAALARRLGRLLCRRLAPAGFHLRSASYADAPLGERPVPEVVLHLEDGSRTLPRVLALRTRLLSDGTLLALGYTCDPTELDTVRPLFEEVARSLTLGRPAGGPGGD